MTSGLDLYHSNSSNDKVTNHSISLIEFLNIGATFFRYLQFSFVTPFQKDPYCLAHHRLGSESVHPVAMSQLQGQEGCHCCAESIFLSQVVSLCLVFYFIFLGRIVLGRGLLFCFTRVNKKLKINSFKALVMIFILDAFLLDLI